MATSTLPLAPGSYVLDRAHSGIHFQVRHLGLSNVRGVFKSFTASLVVGETLGDVVVEAEVDLSSIDTSQPDRDAHLLSSDFFNAEASPTMTFRSTAITAARGSDRYEMTGDLTIKGVTRSVSFDVEFNGAEVFPGDQSTHVGFDATGTVRRNDFGIEFNMPLGMDKLALGEKVKVELDIQFIAP